MAIPASQSDANHSSDLPCASELSDIPIYNTTNRTERTVIINNSHLETTQIEDIDDPLTMEERIDLIELDIDHWLPMLFQKKGRVGAFIWSVLQHSPETFVAQMHTLINSAQPLLDRVFELSSLCVTQMDCHFERVQDLALSIHLVVAAITVRVSMVQGGLVSRFPDIMTWEQ